LTALERALELPDDEPTPWGWRVAAVAVAAWIALAVAGARVLALGGYRWPLLIVGSLLAIPAALLAWALASAERHRTWITGAAMLAAVACIPLAITGATPSTARLAEIADGIGLPGRVVRDHRLGNGRCRPACSEIRRVAFVDDDSLAAVEFGVTSAFRRRGYELTIYPHASGVPARIDAKRGRTLVSVEIASITLARTRIATVFIAQGPAPHHSVG
jgi:hypothetical protein